MSNFGHRLPCAVCGRLVGIDGEPGPYATIKRHGNRRRPCSGSGKRPAKPKVEPERPPGDLCASAGRT